MLSFFGDGSVLNFLFWKFVCVYGGGALPLNGSLLILFKLTFWL